MLMFATFYLCFVVFTFFFTASFMRVRLTKIIWGFCLLSGVCWPVFLAAQLGLFAGEVMRDLDKRELKDGNA